MLVLRFWLHHLVELQSKAPSNTPSELNVHFKYSLKVTLSNIFSHGCTYSELITSWLSTFKSVTLWCHVLHDKSSVALIRRHKQTHRLHYVEEGFTGNPHRSDWQYIMQCLTRQLPIGAGHCPWGGHTDRNTCNIHWEVHLASRYPHTKIQVRRSMGCWRRGGDLRKEGRKES